MLEIGSAIRFYSQLNPQIDFVIVFKEENEDLQEIQEIIEKAWTEWWELDEAASMPVGDYISKQLKSSGKGFEIFWKDGSLDEND